MKTFRKVLALLPFVLGAVVLMGTDGCCPDNPPLNSVVTAHGNTDWHIDTAEEFLYGTDMDGHATAANHVPNSWTRRHMHVGLTNTSSYYYDADRVATGADADGTSGIESAMLFFYAGHGSPTSWSTLGDHASQANVCLGDCPGGGMLRYYWQCSCKVFAHGPKSCAGSSWDYGCPGGFTGGADSVTMRNVYERWGPALDSDVRMACGASTSAYCHESQTNAIWNYYNNLGYDVADAFISGLNFWGVVPLCITRGGADVTATPLYDATFTNLANDAGTSHFHIQYLSSFAATPSASATSASPESSELPETMPVFRLRPNRLYRSMTGVSFSEEGEMMVSSEEVAGRPRVRYNPASGAVYLVAAPTSPAGGETLEESAYLERAERFLEQSGLSAGMERSAESEERVGEPVGERMMIQVSPVKGGGDDAKTLQKNVVVTFRRQIEVDGRRIEVLGSGGMTRIRMSNDGSVSDAAQVWREIDGVERVARVKSYDEAYREAREMLEEPEAYELDRWDWGYKEEAGNVEQSELGVVFRFGFVPADPDATMEHPPRLIEIPGQER